MIVIDGDIDHSSSGEIQEAIEQALIPSNDILLVDLANVSYIDSGGLSVLFTAGRRVRDIGWIGLISPNASVLRLLELVGAVADPAFRVFDSREQAESALAESRTQ